MRGLLVVNPKATATTDRTRDVLIHALADQFSLETVRTDHRGHAMELGRRATQEKLDVVVVLGGDGTVNETVNGMLADFDGVGNAADDLPKFGAIPGGSANVFTRALGFPPEPVEATGELVDALRNDRTRVIGLGRCDYVPAPAPNDDGEDSDDPDIATETAYAAEPIRRWITFNAGLGLDAEIIHNMERLRAKGKDASPTRYLTTTLRTFFADTDRKHPRLTMEVPGTGEVPGVFLAIIQNASPWTYLGNMAVNPLPETDWDNGLGLWAVRRFGVLDGLRYSRRILMKSSAGSTKNGLFVGKDLASFAATANPPVELQIDGEGLGSVQSAKFASFPSMLRVYI